MYTEEDEEAAAEEDGDLGCKFTWQNILELF